jgi:hypothetical protein
MKKSFKQADLLVIYWKDITSVDSWLDNEIADSYPALEVVSVGWFVNQDEECIRVTNTISTTQRTILVIPKGVITDIKIAKYERG